MKKAAPRQSHDAAMRDREVAGRFLELLGAMKRYVRELLPPLAGGGMSEERFRTLLTLRYYGKGYLKTLATHDGLSSSALCIMLNRMVEEGFAGSAGQVGDSHAPEPGRRIGGDRGIGLVFGGHGAVEEA